MQGDVHPIAQEYHDALRRGDPRAEELLVSWEAHVRGLLEGLRGRVEERQPLVERVVGGGRGYAGLYASLTVDYRLAVSLQRELSVVKRLLRESRKK
jgi:hypothetical protein